MDIAQVTPHTSFEWNSDATSSILYIPFWFLVMLSAAVGTIPWLTYRFSLRTLLIATTLVAVVLGLIVWL